MKMPKMFRKKEDYVLQRDEDLLNIRSAFFDVVNHQNVLTDTIKVLMSMADKQRFIYMWLKDSNDRYIFASKNAREKLFNNRHISKIINRTDSEITTGEKMSIEIEDSLFNITPDKLPLISEYIEKDTLICNLTDVITRVFHKPCKFVENINDMIWIVWKEPLFSDGIYNGCVGYALDMTNKKEEVYQLISERVEEGNAFKIDNTNNYYLVDYSFPELHPRRFI